MSKPIFEEEGKAPVAGMATAQQKIEKQARQLAYDTRYEVKKEIGDKQVTPAIMKQLLLRRLQRSSAAPNIKLRAKQMLLGEDYIGNIKELVSETVANALFKVFVENNNLNIAEEIKLNYLNELNQDPSRKYKVRVTDKKTGNTYVRYATREKISQLRLNPNIQSVEMTEYGEPREGERRSGEQTAKAKAGKGLDPVGKEDSKGDLDNDGIPASRDKNDQYLLKRRAAIGNAIKKRETISSSYDQEGQLIEEKKANKKKIKKWWDDDGDGIGYEKGEVRKEEFLADAATKNQNSDTISGKNVNNYGGKNPVVKVMPEDPTAQVRKGIYSHYEPKSEVIAETGYSKFLGMLQEKSESEQQQKLFGLALSVKRGKTPRSEVSAEVLKIVDSMSEKEIRKFAKTKHEGLPKKVQKEEKECGCEEESKSSKKGEMDVRELPTKMNIIKNKMRAIGLKMSYEPEGEQIDEIAPIVAAPLVVGGAVAAYKGLQHLKKKGDEALNKARSQYAGSRERQVQDILKQSYQPEGEIIDENLNSIILYMINEEIVNNQNDAIDMLSTISESALAKIAAKALPGVIKKVGSKLTKTQLPPKMDPAMKFIKDKIKQQYGAASLMGTPEYKYAQAARQAELRRNPPSKPKPQDPFPGDVYSRSDFGIRGYRSGD